MTPGEAALLAHARKLCNEHHSNADMLRNHYHNNPEISKRWNETAQAAIDAFNQTNLDDDAIENKKLKAQNQELLEALKYLLKESQIALQSLNHVRCSDHDVYISERSRMDLTYAVKQAAEDIARAEKP